MAPNMFARHLRIPAAWSPCLNIFWCNVHACWKYRRCKHQKKKTCNSENSPQATTRYLTSQWAVAPRKSLQHWWEGEKTGNDALGWEGVASQITVCVCIFDFTRLLPISKCDLDVQQVKSNPADFGVPDALRKWSFSQMEYFVPYVFTDQLRESDESNHAVSPTNYLILRSQKQILTGNILQKNISVLFVVIC